MALTDWINDRTQKQQPVADKPQAQKPEAADTREAAPEKMAGRERLTSPEQTKIDRVRATLEKATRHRTSQTPVEAQANANPIDAKLARATRFVDTMARPRPEIPTKVRWPRPPASWER